MRLNKYDRETIEQALLCARDINEGFINGDYDDADDLYDICQRYSRFHELLKRLFPSKRKPKK